MSSTRILKVAVPSPLRKTFDYLAPGKHQDMDLRGRRVKVPFGSRNMTGIVVAESEASELPRSQLKSIAAILDDEALLDSATRELHLWASEYYHFPIGLVFQTSLPKFLREGRPATPPENLLWQLTAKGKQSSAELLNRAPRQKEVFTLLQEAAPLSPAQFKALSSYPVQPFLQALEEKGLAESMPAPVLQPDSVYGADRPLNANLEQAEIIRQISGSLGRYHCFLLQGITGSGKTEVYLQCMATALEQGLQVLVLVPEISLTPQTIKRFGDRFSCRIAVLHSGLNDSERFDSWLGARNGEAGILIGTRSAIFTPLARPGLLIVDEEHDNSYKQQDGFRYNARDVAIYRGSREGVPVILGSATPSLESLHNAMTHRYRHCQLKQRAGNASLPTFQFVDIRSQQLQEGFSQILLEQIKWQIQQGNQVLIFINRRGFAPILQCHDCGWIATCPRCQSSYTLHYNPKILRCHHCDKQKPMVPKCPDCGSHELNPIGTGTERSELFLQQYFPEVPVIRVDRDSTRGKTRLHELLEEVNKGLACILIGTQMLAKGHHFPKVTLVGILDADRGLFSADFRGQEKMGQLITQVAGRAGREQIPGRVLIQTHHSSHPALNRLIEDGYSAFARDLLEERKLTDCPPFSFHALFRAEAADPQAPLEFLRKIKDRLSLANRGQTVMILGPMPAPMEKRAGKFRAQLLLQARQRSPLHGLLHHVLPTIETDKQSRKVRWSLDIDPQDFL